MCVYLCMYKYIYSQRPDRIFFHMPRIRSPPPRDRPGNGQSQLKSSMRTLSNGAPPRSNVTHRPTGWLYRSTGSAAGECLPACLPFLAFSRRAPRRRAARVLRPCLLQLLARGDNSWEWTSSSAARVLLVRFGRAFRPLLFHFVHLLVHFSDHLLPRLLFHPFLITTPI